MEIRGILKKVSITLSIFLLIIWLFSFLIGYNQPFWHETEGSYIVLNINSEKNRNKDENKFFYGNSKNIYKYSLEDGEESVGVNVDGTNTRIEDFAVWKEKIYYITSTYYSDNEVKWEVSSFDFQSSKQEVLLTHEDCIYLNEGQEITSAGLDVYKDYLFFEIDVDKEFICKLNENISENIISVHGLFEDDGLPGDIQQTEYDGIIFERKITSEGEFDITNIRDTQGYKILYPNVEIWINVDGECVRLRKDDRTEQFQYREEEEHSWRNISTFSKKEYEDSDIEGDHLVVENGRIIGLLSVSNHPIYRNDLPQRYIKKDVLFELDIKTGESRILYDTKNNLTKIIGYQEGIMYFIRDEKIYAYELDDKKKTEIGNLPKGKDYIIDWQAKHLIIREEYGDIVFVHQLSD